MKKITKENYGLPYSSAENNLIMAALYVAEVKLRERKMISESLQEKGRDTSHLDKENKKIRTAINTLRTLEGCY